MPHSTYTITETVFSEKIKKLLLSYLQIFDFSTTCIAKLWKCKNRRLFFSCIIRQNYFIHYWLIQKSYIMKVTHKIDVYFRVTQMSISTITPYNPCVRFNWWNFSNQIHSNIRIDIFQVTYKTYSSFVTYFKFLHISH